MRFPYFILSAALLTSPAWAEEVSKEKKNEPLIVNLEDLDKFAPSAAELLHNAVDLQIQKKYGDAISSFLKIFEFYPKSPEAEESMYRIAECYRAVGRFDDAKKTLRALREKFPSSTWLEGSYLLEGEMDISDKNWDAAVRSLKSSAKSKLPDIQIRSLFLIVLAYEKIQKPDDALKYIRELAGIDQNNPYRAYACLRMGNIIEKKNSKEAIDWYYKAWDFSDKEDIKAQASVRSAHLNYIRQDFKKALMLYQQTPEKELTWRRLANLGVIQTYFQLKNYAKAVESYLQFRPEFPEAAQTEVMFIAGEAYRLQSKNEEALALYEKVMKEHAASTEAEPCAWARLLIFKETKSPAFDEAAESFIKTFPKADRVALVYSMQAERAFDNQKYDDAVTYYKKIFTNKKVDVFAANAQPLLYFQYGKSLFLTKKNTDAAAILQEYLTKFPQGSWNDWTYWLLAHIYQNSQKWNEASDAWKSLINNYPSFSEREKSLWEAATMESSQKKFPVAEIYYQKLLTEFPVSTSAPDATFLLGITQSQNKKNPAAIESLKRARLLNNIKFDGPATQEIIKLQLQQENLKDLILELEHYEDLQQRTPTLTSLNPEVYEWVAQKEGNKETVLVERYLNKALLLAQSKESRKRVQLKLGLFFSETQNWGKAVTAWSSYRVNFPEEADRNEILEHLAKAHIGVRDYKSAEKILQQLLRQNPEGEFFAKGNLMLGDISYSQRLFEDAAKKYRFVYLLANEEDMKKLALQKAVDSYEKAGQPDEAKKLTKENSQVH